MKILVINGPNLGLLGVREPEIYGYTTLADVENNLQKIADEKNCTLEFLQSNHEIPGHGYENEALPQDHAFLLRSE